MGTLLRLQKRIGSRRIARRKPCPRIVERSGKRRAHAQKSRHCSHENGPPVKRKFHIRSPHHTTFAARASGKAPPSHAKPIAPVPNPNATGTKHSNRPSQHQSEDSPYGKESER